MPDRDKIIKALETCSIQNDFGCQNCPYFEDRKKYGHEWCTTTMAQDALSMMKEQKEREKRICKEICGIIKGGYRADTDDDREYICHRIQYIFLES